MRNTFAIYIMLLLSSVTSTALALQVRSLPNNGTAHANIAIDGLTRIAVENDRILHVLGPDGRYQLQEDNTQGAIYLHPLNVTNSVAAMPATASDPLTVPVTHSTDNHAVKTAEPLQPFTLFIATENGQNFVLHLMPRDQTADTILIKSTDGVNPKAQAWETASPYTESVTALLKGMATGQAPDGYAVSTLIKATAAPLGDIALIKPLSVYDGGYLKGLVYRVTNKTPIRLTLTEREFYQPEDRAIALVALTVPPYGSTLLYKVVAHD